MNNFVIVGDSFIKKNEIIAASVSDDGSKRHPFWVVTIGLSHGNIRVHFDGKLEAVNAFLELRKELEKP